MINEYENKAFTSYKKKILLNAPLKHHPAGHIMDIDTDKDGVPLSQYWRNRIKDAKEDGCVEIITNKPSTDKKRSKK